MPRKYTRRSLSPATPAVVDASSTEPASGGAKALDREAPAAGLYAPQLTALDQVPATRVLSALEEYGLWLKQNQHITNALPPEPTNPRKGLAHVPPRH